MERTALPGRLTWQLGEVVATQPETARTKSLTLSVPKWVGHLAGQHVDIRLTSDDGYQAERSYSIASPPEDGQQLILTIERLDDGEVSPYLTEELRVGDKLELTWSHRRLLRLGGAPGRTLASDCRWIRHRAPHGDDPAPQGRGKCHLGTVACLVSHL